MMPAALSAVIEYARECAHFAAQQRNRVAHSERGESDENGAAEATIPRHAPEIMSAFKECAEFAEEDAAEAVANLLGDLQIYDARLRDFIARLDGTIPGNTIHIVTTHNVDERIYDAAHLYASAEALFPYARRENSDTPELVDAQGMWSALRMCNIEDYVFPDVYDMVERRFTQDSD